MRLRRDYENCLVTDISNPRKNHGEMESAVLTKLTRKL